MSVYDYSTYHIVSDDEFDRSLVPLIIDNLVSNIYEFDSKFHTVVINEVYKIRGRTQVSVSILEKRINYAKE